jgi:hypothetical protein
VTIVVRHSVSLLLRCKSGRESAPISFWHRGRIVHDDLVTEVRNLNLILLTQVCLLNALTITVNSVRTAKVSNDQAVLELNDTTVSARDLLGVDAHVAIGVTTDKDDRPIQTYQRTIFDGNQSHGHEIFSILKRCPRRSICKWSARAPLIHNRYFATIPGMEPDNFSIFALKQRQASRKMAMSDRKKMEFRAVASLITAPRPSSNA